MKVNLNSLYKPFEIDEEIFIPKEYYELTDIKEIKNLYVKGKVFYNLTEEVEIDLMIKGIMVLTDSITLELIDYPFKFSISENLTKIGEEFQESLKKNQNVLDIIEFLWENIILEVPISITKAENTKLKGDGWELNGDESEIKIDSRLAKLNDMFKGGE